MTHQIYADQYWRLDQRLRDGPVGPFVDEFASLLLSQGYGERYLRHRFVVVAELNRWLVGKKLDLAELDKRRIDQFVRYRSQGKLPDMSRRGEMATLKKFIGLIRSRAAVAAEVAVEEARDPFGEVLSAYKEYLIQEKGLACETISRYSSLVSTFLSHLFDGRPMSFSELTVEHITSFIREYAKDRSGSDSSMMVCSIRSFLRFLSSRGEIRGSLAESVPAVVSQLHKRIPCHLSADELKRLLRCCRATNPVNRRNYAIILLLARLGLRASEVARLTLDDIDWEHGELTIQGKGNRQTPLPLPKEVGNALVAYLKHGRPSCATRRLFITARAPYHPFSNGTLVSVIVNQAVKRAGLNPKKKGAHLLRHTLATECLRKGATLTEVGQILRHESIDTTAIYAKVDFVRLRCLAMPWPIASCEGGVG
jgi:site-specific recombinase XerD